MGVGVAADNYSCMEGQAKTLYFRRKNKTCYALELRRQPLYRSLLLLLAKREAIPPERLLLFSRGQPLTQAFDFTRAAEKQIIHIVDEADTQGEHVTFHLRFPNRPLTTHTLPSSTLVRDFILRELSSITDLAYFQLGLVYLGKIMHPRKTLREEYLENQAEIIVVNIKEFLKGKHIDKVADLLSPAPIPAPTSLPPDGKQHALREGISEVGVNNEKKEDISPLAVQVKPSEEKTSQPKANIMEESSAQPASSPTEDHPPFNTNNELPVPQTKELSIIAFPLTPKDPIPADPTPADPNLNDPNEYYNPPSSLITEPPLSQLDLLNAPECQFRIKVSEVHSVGSDESHHNLVIFQPDQDIEPIDELKSNIEAEQPSLNLGMPKQSLREFDLSPGDFMLPSPTHPSQTNQFIDKVLKDYKFLFEST